MDELISCILSQNTSDSNSFPAFFRMKEIYPKWQQIVNAGPEKIAEIIKSAGLANQKAKAIINCLTAIKKETGDYNIDFLDNMPMKQARTWLEKLPGVGPKTSAIVLCFSFNKNAIPVDTHIFRVSKRLGFIPEKMDANKAHDHLLEVIPNEEAYNYHMLLIQHGRTICKARKPLCEKCPLTQNCLWYKNN